MMLSAAVSFVLMEMMVMQCRLLPELTTIFVPSQVIQPWKPSLATQMMPLADHVLVLRPMTRHVSAKVAALAVQPLPADVAVRLILARVGGGMVSEDLFIHEGLGAAGEGAFEGPRLVCLRSGQVLLRDVASKGSFGRESGVTAGPGAYSNAFRAVDSFEVFAEIGSGGESSAASVAAGHYPLADSARGA